ncbi:MAG: carboxylating nicotinate-nucleotide diphosphorylase [Planctomycetota bacterium]|jgi:nicotinate-nucleotide pyrophosphorylase (carboxylating)
MTDPIQGWTAEETEALRGLMKKALAEDIGEGDLTSRALIPSTAQATARIQAKAEGILAGTPAAAAVFREVDPETTFTPLVAEGARVTPGTVVAEVSGKARSLLAAERTALNFLQRLSGVATLTRRTVDAVTGTKAKIFDTRKTLPAFRLLDKYAVRTGGGCNHRMGLYDAVLIKENHLEAGSCGPGEAVRRARAMVPSGTLVEVEVETLDQCAEALDACPDVILLDNMSVDEIRRAVSARGPDPPPALEVSGGVTLDSVRHLGELGVDRISVGALTHSATALDLSLSFTAADRP